jgi:GR25 family glycosyltransferase involved in LPS biosynthesis
MKYYCIHHSPAKERKEYIQNNIIDIYNLDILWIEDYLPESDIINNHPKVYSKHSANRKYLNQAELSCYLKHKLAINTIVTTNEYGFILEDDIKVPSFHLTDMVEAFLVQMKKIKCDILFVGSIASCDLNLTEPCILCNKNTIISRAAHSYIISPNRANELVEYLNNIRAPLDLQINFAIEELNLKSGWSYPHIYQRTEKSEIKSLLR